MEKMHQLIPWGREPDPSPCHTSKAVMLCLSLRRCFAAPCPHQVEFLHEAFV